MAKAAPKPDSSSNATMLIGTILLIYVVESTAASASSFVAPTRRRRPSCSSSFHYRRGMVDSSSVMHSKRSNGNWNVSSSRHDDYKQRSRIRRSQCTAVLNLALEDDDNGEDVNYDDDDAELDRTNYNKRATFFGLEPRELPPIDEGTPVLSVDDGLQFTGPIIMILSIYFTLALFFGDVDDGNNVVGGDTTVTSSTMMMTTDPYVVSNGYVRTWAESSSINGYF